jgi:hypothetical protein
MTNDVDPWSHRRTTMLSSAPIDRGQLEPQVLLRRDRQRRGPGDELIEIGDGVTALDAADLRLGETKPTDTTATCGNGRGPCDGWCRQARMALPMC